MSKNFFIGNNCLSLPNDYDWEEFNRDIGDSMWNMALPRCSSLGEQNGIILFFLSLGYLVQ